MLAEKGMAKAVIVTPTVPTAQEMYAATELRHYLNLMTGAPFKVVREDESGGDAQSGVIMIGKLSKLSADETGAWGDDDFCVKSDKKGCIRINGGKRGIIYGVYELLEHMGCRFFTPLSEKIPVIPDLKMPEINTVQKPVLEYRAHNYKDLVQNPRFAVKSRINMGRMGGGGIVAGGIPEEFGGAINYAWFVHSFASEIIHPDEYFDQHPEYFSMVDGKRLRDFSQLCLTNPDVLKIAVEKVRGALRSKPDCRIISISPNDWYSNCTCPDCAAIDNKEGTGAGSLVWFINEIADMVKDEFPDVIIDTLAYQYTRQAPSALRPRDNVCMRLCSIESCFSHPFESCDDDSRKTARPDGTRTSFLEDLREWAKVCDRLYIWDYTTCFAHYPAPHANWNVLQPNMKAFIESNAKGVFEQACGAIGGSTDLNEMRTYVICKLLWDADCDVEKHMREFAEFFYGAAAPHILDYVRALTDKVEKENIHIGFNDQCNLPHLSDEMLDVYEKFFDKAAGAVASDPIRFARVDKARLSLRWVRLKNKQMRDNSVCPEEVNKFFTDWRAHGLTRIDEWVSAETTLRAMLEGKWRGTEFYVHWDIEGPEKV